MSSSWPVSLIKDDSNIKVQIISDNIIILCLESLKNITLQESILFHIIKYILSSSTNKKFCNISKSESETSIILDVDIIKNIDTFSNIIYNDYYTLFEILYQESQLEEIGIVNEITGIFLNAVTPIPIVYINTYSKNFILVDKRNKKNAIEIFKQNDFDINI